MNYVFDLLDGAYPSVDGAARWSPPERIQEREGPARRDPVVAFEDFARAVAPVIGAIEGMSEVTQADLRLA